MLIQLELHRPVVPSPFSVAAIALWTLQNRMPTLGQPAFVLIIDASSTATIVLSSILLVASSSMPLERESS